MNKKNIKLIAKLIFEYKWKHIRALSFLVISSLLMVTLPYITINIMDNAIPNKNMKLLISLIIAFFLVSVFQNFSRIVSDYIYCDIGKSIENDLRNKLFSHIQNMSGKYYTDVKTGDLMSTITFDVEVIESLSTSSFFQIISEVLIAIPTCILLMQLQLDLFILVIIIQPLMITVQRRFSKEVSQSSENIRNSYSKFNIILQEYLSSALNINILGANKYFSNRYKHSLDEFKQNELTIQKILSARSGLLNLIFLLINIGIYGYGGYKVISGTLTIGTLMAFIQYSTRILNPFFRIANFHNEFKRSDISINRVFDLLDIKAEVINGNIKDIDITGNVEFKEVQFGYEDSKVLNGLNIKFDSGKTSAIVGGSGSGKSTIINLICRLWDPEEGVILIDNKDIRNYTIDLLRNNISIVSQDISLFNDTIFNNLTILNESIDFDSVIEVSKKVDIYDFIMSLPEQFETVIGDRGIKLSGGQKQRIAIARALLKNSSIVVFDEATSALDNLTEQNIKETIQRYLKDKTIIIIAHRLSTIEDADVIYMLENGAIIEEGTHNELIQNYGKYYKLYTSSLELEGCV